MRHQKTKFSKEYREKETVSAPFLVKYVASAQGKTGKPYMNLVLTDKQGDLEARVWDIAAQVEGQVLKDSYVWVDGVCQLYQGRMQVVIKRVSVLLDEQIEPSEYIQAGTLDVEVLYAQLMSFVSSMQDPFYRALAESILRDDADIVDRVKRAPAAKSFHHAYRSGLLEHMVSIVETLDFMSQHYSPYVDRDLLFLGGFLHDIGKIWELTYEKTTDYTNEGRLIGHLVMGVELVERKVQWLETQEGRLPGVFPVEKKMLVKHVILAHHGELAYGSPKVPVCLEALIVHYVDDLDSKVNAIRMFTEQDQSPGEWTLLNKNYERYFYKPEWARK